MLARLASFCYRRRRWVLAAWLAVLVLFTMGSKAVGAHWMTSMSLPNSDAGQAQRIMDASFPGRSGEPATAVVSTPSGATSPATAARVDAFVHALRATPGVADVQAPIVSRSGTVELVPFNFAAKGHAARTSATHVSVLAATERHQGLDVELSGMMFQKASLGSSEVIGIMAAVVVLLVAFGSVVAMGLPIVTALFGIGVGMAGVELWSHLVATPEFTVQVATMIGLGVGIDYALFIVTRYREALARKAPEDAVVEAVTTAGRAVLFAGSVVLISLLGMILMRLDFVGGLAVGSSTAVAVSVAGALTLLPALLGFAGDKVNRLSIHRRSHPAGGETRWHRWSRLLQRHPVPAAAGALLVLCALAVPALGMRLGFSDAGNDPATQTTRVAYDLVARGFGPGANGPLAVVAELHGPSAVGRIGNLVTSLEHQPGVAAVLPPELNAAHTAAIVEVLPTTSPQAAATVSLVHQLRSHVLAPYQTSDLSVHVGGPTAAGVDYSTVVGQRLPIFIGAVLLLSFALLLAVFRSVLIPLKAVVVNLLSIGSAYGVMVAIFQWGWAKSLFGVGHGGPIDPWIPMMLFAIVFGLSMDYEVFLLSRIREEHERTGDNSAAVVEGLAGTGRVITAAAAIMVAVFASFVLGDLRAIKIIGTGLAAAIFIDATVVRCVLVPAVMELLGERNWWMPARLGRIAPRIPVDPVGEPEGELVPVAA